MADDLTLELVKTIVPIFVTLGVGWVIGDRIAVHWAIRQKRKELQLTVASDFEEIYGKFYSIWKMWNYFLAHQMKTIGKIEDLKTYFDILDRACDTNGRVEVIILKLASEFVLNEEEINIISTFRKSFRILRRSIRDQKEIPWNSSKHPDYVEFKHAASTISNIITQNGLFRMPSRKEASDNFIKITLHKHNEPKSKMQT